MISSSMCEEYVLKFAPYPFVTPCVYIYIYTFGLEAIYFCQIIKAIKMNILFHLHVFFVEFEAVGDYWKLCKAFGLFKVNFIQKTIIL